MKKTQNTRPFFNAVVPVSLHLSPPPNILNKAAPCHTDTDYQEEVWLQCETNRGKRREKNHVKPMTVDYLFCSSYSLLLRMLVENITQKLRFISKTTRHAGTNA